MYDDYRINKITVNSFRGISYESSLELGDITILCGENGTGKSSFVDAFKYIFSINLDAPSRKRIINPDFVLHKGCEEENMDVQIFFDNNKVLKISEKNKDPELNEILDDEYVKNVSFILNRKNLLKFIDGNSTDKYNAVMELCGFKKLSRYQSHFLSTYNRINKEYLLKKDEYEDGIIKLSNLFVDDEILTIDSSINELNKILERNDLNPIDKETNIPEYLSNLHLNIDSSLNDIKHEFDSIFSAMSQNDFDLELNSLLSKFDNVIYDNFKSANDLIVLLEKSYNYIDSNNSEKCPICDSDIDKNILRKINDNLENLKEQDKEFSLWKNEFNMFSSQLNDFIYDLDDLDQKIIKLNSKDSESINTNFNNEKLILRNLYSDLNDLLNTGEKIKVNPTLFKDINDRISLLKENLNKYFEENSENSDLLLINNALIELDKIKDLEWQIANLNSKQSVAKIALDTFTSTKEEFINKIINDIKDDIKHFYEFIHKGDEINSPDIQLPDHNHIEIYLNSFGENVDPRSFASEGHLDSLGLCIFLAFNKKFNQIPFIVLDDVIATVDMGHKEKIARLLTEELDDYQIFVTTHSKLWAEQLKRLTNIANRTAKPYEIIAWNKKEGPILATPVDSEERIQKYLNPDHYDLNAAGNTARRYFEHILKEICKANELEIPYGDRPQCEDFYKKASSHINKSAKGTFFEKYYKDIWDELKKTKFLANILSHDNVDFDEVSYNEVEDFCNSVIKLRKKVTCEKHNYYIKFDKSKKSMECSKDECNFLIDMKTFELEQDLEEE